MINPGNFCKVGKHRIFADPVSNKNKSSTSHVHSIEKSFQNPIEHFSNTNEIVSALAGLLKPGGVILTNIPNMRGTIGFVQKILNRGIYDIHVPLTPSQVQSAHEAAGLCAIEADYFLSSNYGVVNLGDPNRRNPGWWAKKIALAILARMSMAVWLTERMLGKLPVSQAFSPYVNCIAMRPRSASL